MFGLITRNPHFIESEGLCFSSRKHQLGFYFFQVGDHPKLVGFIKIYISQSLI